MTYNGTIKAIETEYKGYRFRSRTEARAAVLLDAFGAVWEYEKEGWELSDGSRYLPDFYLPQHDAYVEVKGSAVSETEKHKARLLAEGSGKPVFVIAPDSDGNFQDVARFGWDIKELSISRELAQTFRYSVLYDYLCPFCEEKGTWTQRDEEPGKFSFILEWDCFRHFLLLELGNDKGKDTTTAEFSLKLYGFVDDLLDLLSNCVPSVVVTAQSAAKKARFEHGENGRHAS